MLPWRNLFQWRTDLSGWSDRRCSTRDFYEITLLQEGLIENGVSVGIASHRRQLDDSSPMIGT